jgi:hypothetical protein
MTEAQTASVIGKASNKLSAKKRKAETVRPVIPQLIDNKRKHMERQLSAAQRDQLLLQESKEDSKFKRDMTKAIKQSDQTFANAMQQMSQSIVQVVESLTQSMKVFVRGSGQPVMQPVMQSMMQRNNQTPYQHHYTGLNSPAVYNNFGTHQFNFEECTSQIPDDSGEKSTYHTL